jgi:mannose-6-phosphate isomerase-like protein (cupin superfamily)
MSYIYDLPNVTLMSNGILGFETKRLPKDISYLAPDGSQIRKLPDVRGGGLAHCVLPPSKTAMAHEHKTVDEIWFFIEGQGKVWRKQGDREEIVEVESGTSLTIPKGTHFQFRNTGDEDLCIVIATMPVWPGPNEAERVQDYWKPSSQ